MQSLQPNAGLIRQAFSRPTTATVALMHAACQPDTIHCMKLLKWELIDEGPISSPTSPALLFRTKIPGGWLVTYHISESRTITFVPDPKHEWDGTSLP
jgi:hypothetical protein